MPPAEAVVVVPKLVADKVESLGVDLESYVVEAPLQKLGPDPLDEARVSLKLAEKYFREGTELVGRDPVQAGEKLHKAAEGVAKALATTSRETLKRVEG